MDKNTSKYKGVRRNRTSYGRMVYTASIYCNSKSEYLGCYKDEKEAAKAYDMYVIRNGLNRETNFIKKKK